jgi:lipid A disaccharide synthetase
MEVIKEKMKKAKTEKKDQRAIILLHDVGGRARFVERHLQAFIDAIEELSKEEKVEVVFDTMKEVVYDP